MNTDPLIRALDAVIDQDSSVRATPSGPILTLLTEPAEEGDLKGFSNAFTLFRLAHPQNAASVMSTVPAKVLNGYLLKHLRLNSAAFQQWEEANRTWAKDVTVAVPDSQLFERTVRDIAESIRSAQNARNS